MIRQIEIKEGKGFEECKLLELTGNNIFICSKPRACLKNILSCSF